ncbi:terminase large subunit domain-containing protein [Pontiella desulfatans]|uniref:terminase large subunit domain-containing protein n=1 Tax=Pontiella desulfatans TaxID=2750659 RepID=UPI0014444296|nr:terminase family protein [Pontiella desulfatans]
MPGDYGWVAPTYNVAERGREALCSLLPGACRSVGRTPTRVEFLSENDELVRVWFLSADNPENIRGYGFRGLVIDEAALVPLDVWNYILRPTIAQTLGWAVFISTPKGRNWFYDMYTRGNDPEEPDFESFHFRSNESKYFPAEEWDEAQRTLPADVFKQEYEAEFLEDSAGVFRKVSSCLIPESAITRDDRAGPVVIGCDVAKCA